MNIHHKISDTYKEIYTFTQLANVWYYTSIGFSRRNNKDDIWGDEWEENFHDEFHDASLKLSEDYDNGIISDYQFDTMYHDLKHKYLPTCNHTKHGKPYYTGAAWSIGWSTSNEYPPKISKDDIKREILERTKEIEIVL
jgi:hypothetical protein